MTRRIIPLVLVVLLLSACTPGAITSDLNTVVSAVSLALPILSLVGVPPQVITLAQQYLQSVTVAVERTTAELASADAGPVKAGKIAQYFAAAIVPNLPPGTSPIVGQLLTTVTQAVQSFVSHFAGGQALAAAPPVYKLTRGDKQELSKIKVSNAANMSKLVPARP